MSILDHHSDEDEVVKFSKLRYSYIPTLDVLRRAKERLMCYPNKSNLDIIKIRVELQTEESYDYVGMTDRFCLASAEITFRRYLESSGNSSWVYVGPVKLIEEFTSSPKKLERKRQPKQLESGNSNTPIDI